VKFLPGAVVEVRVDGPGGKAVSPGEGVGVGRGSDIMVYCFIWKQWRVNRWRGERPSRLERHCPIAAVL